MSLYKSLVNTISCALKQSLNEMARMTPVRTIDRKLWLTVASACSRNRSTEAEDVKPVGHDKDNLVQRYVAALLIMKKPCPQTIQEVNELKTFKLVAKRAFELGATIEDIQNLYAQNTGSKSAVNPKQTAKPQQTHQQESPKSSSLFDDDLFGDDDDMEYDGSGTSLVDEIVGFNPKTKISIVLTNLIGLDKPRGFKLYKSDGVSYEKAIQESEIYWRHKYIRDFEGLLQSKGWKELNAPKLNNVYDENYEAHNLEQFKEEVKRIIQRRYSHYEQEYKDKQLQKQIEQYTEWNNMYPKFERSLTTRYEKELFSDRTVKKAYISPDGGMVYYVKREPNTGNSYSYGWGQHVLTFTGDVNYSYLTNNEYTSKTAVKNAKLEKQCLTKYKEFVRNTVHIRFGWSFIMYDGRPICYASIGKNSLTSQTLWFDKHYGKSSTTTSDSKGIMEYTYKKAETEGDYIRILFRYNDDKKFGTGDIAMITYLTEKGIQRFNEYYNKKYESILRI